MIAINNIDVNIIKSLELKSIQLYEIYGSHYITALISFFENNDVTVFEKLDSVMTESKQPYTIDMKELSKNLKSINRYDTPSREDLKANANTRRTFKKLLGTNQYSERYKWGPKDAVYASLLTGVHPVSAAIDLAKPMAHLVRKGINRLGRNKTASALVRSIKNKVYDSETARSLGRVYHTYMLNNRMNKYNKLINDRNQANDNAVEAKGGLEAAWNAYKHARADIGQDHALHGARRSFDSLSYINAKEMAAKKRVERQRK